MQLTPGILMHDNARPHTARLTQNYLARHKVKVLQLPACSLDMNPIEHVWDVLGRRVRENHVINNVNDLRATLSQEWNVIPMTLLDVTSGQCAREWLL